MNISIIIPFYNASSYLERCLNSIFSQETYESTIEIICVDDCSNDMGSKIVKDFQKSHTNLRLFTHSENRKQGAARNLGLQKSRFDYIWFVDADDYVEVNMLHLLLEKLKYHKPDILQFNSAKILQNGTKQDGHFWNKEITNVSGIKYLEMEMKEKYSNRIVAVWSKIFKKNFLIENNLFFKEGIYWEDVTYTLCAFIKAKSVVYTPLSVYNYVQTKNSDMRSSYNGRKIADSIRYCVEATNIAHQNIQNNDLRTNIINKYIPTILKYKGKVNELTFEEYSDFERILDSFESMDLLHMFMPEEACGWLLDKKKRLELYENSKNLTT
jgi:glycosyltransferase involved in cell wall biosynthesis